MTSQNNIKAKQTRPFISVSKQAKMKLLVSLIVFCAISYGCASLNLSMVKFYFINK